MSSISVHEAKAHFSEILRRVEGGEVVVVTRHSHPIAEIKPIEGRQKPIRLGVFAGQVTISDDAFDPMTEDELKDWYGED